MKISDRESGLDDVAPAKLMEPLFVICNFLEILIKTVLSTRSTSERLFLKLTNDTDASVEGEVILSHNCNTNSVS